MAFGNLRFKKNTNKQSELTAELYRLRSELPIREKIIELQRSFNMALSPSSRKSPAQIAAEELKKHFHLGNFVIYNGQGGNFIPIISSGMSLRTLKSVRVPVLESRRRDKSSAISSPPNIDLSSIEGRPANMSNPFVFFYPTNGRHLLFIGEDPRGEFARCCSFEHFNREIWPMLLVIHDSAQAYKRNQDRLRELEKSIEEGRRQLEKSNSRNTCRPEWPKLQELSNKIFSIFNEKIMLDSLADFILNTFSCQAVAIFESDEKGKFALTIQRGNPTLLHGLSELSAESQVIKLLKNSPGAILIDDPMAGSAIENHDEKVNSKGLAMADKLTRKGSLSHVLIIKGTNRTQSYDKNDLELLSMMSNMASLALGSISQYCLIEKMSYTDSMTELYNYRYFYKRLNEEIYRARRFNRTLSLVIFDVDNFKTINDSFGHQVGDEILKGLASLVVNSVRAIDVVSRYGGEEFCIIMPETDYSNCKIFMERLRTKIANHNFADVGHNTTYEISVSIGGAIFPQDANTADRLIYCADMALLKAKASGRNKAVMFGVDMIDDKPIANKNEDGISYET